MLQRQHRLTKPAQFTYLRNNGRKFYSNSFLLVYNDKPLPPELIKSEIYPLFGFIASKKVGKAHQRNRAKRLLREAVRVYLPDIKMSVSGIFIASPQTIQTDFQNISGEIQKCFEELGFIKNPRLK